MFRALRFGGVEGFEVWGLMATRALGTREFWVMIDTDGLLTG